MRENQQHQKREVLSFLRARVEEGRPFPTPAELDEAIRSRQADAVGPRSGGPRSARASRGRRFRVLPVAGAIPAGYGDPAEPSNLGEIPVDLRALNISATSRTFVLRVRGDSMIGALIADGDLVVLEAREPKVGEIVAALIDGETTLKRFMAKDGALFLRAENPHYPDLIPVFNLTIQGVVRAVIRVCERPRPVL
jgi:SOS-response transcriptional repressor LexA